MVSAKIKDILAHKGLTQHEVAKRTGLHESTVSLLLSGQIVLEHRLDEIARLLGISRRKLNALMKKEDTRNGRKGRTPGSTATGRRHAHRHPRARNKQKVPAQT